MKALLSLRRLYPVTFALLTLGVYAQTPPSLAIRENGPLVDIVFTGTHTLERADTIDGQWITLGNQTDVFTDPDSGTVNQRFYRINDSGVFSANAVGYYRLNLCAGFSLIANQLDTFSNTVTNILKSVPDGTEVYKYEPSTGGYRYMVFDSETWYANHPDATLNPGEGAYLNSPVPFTQRFLGNLPLNRCVPIPIGFSLISCPQPKAGRLDGASTDALGFPIGDGDQMYRWDCSRGRYLYRVYDSGSWFGGTPATPIINIGESFWMQREPSNGATQWCRTFSVGP